MPCVGKQALHYVQTGVVYPAGFVCVWGGGGGGGGGLENVSLPKLPTAVHYSIPPPPPPPPPPKVSLCSVPPPLAI